MTARLLLDGCTIAGLAHVRPGFFEALSPPRDGRRLYGRLGHDRIPLWATRIHLHPQEMTLLMAAIEPDRPQDIAHEHIAHEETNHAA